jgi:hypothetical protein
MAEQNKFEVVPDDARNPFRATVITVVGDAEFEYGKIRVIPPVTVGDALLENVSVEGDHDLDFWAKGETDDTAATLIDFAQKDTVYSGKLNGRERIEATTRALLEALGGLATSDIV